MDDQVLSRLAHQLDVAPPTLNQAARDFETRAGAGAADDLDRLVEDLHAQGVIDQQTYVRAQSLAVVRSLPAAVGLPGEPRYDVFGPVGEGGMAEIRVGRDRGLRRKVAVKQLKSRDGEDQVLQRFLTEAQVTAQLDHPNVVPVYSLEAVADGPPSFAMKLIHGRTLSRLFADARARSEARDAPVLAHDLSALLEHFLKICDAIAYAHEKGVLHRDLKPDNVMVGEFGEVYVVDWGIARVMADVAVDEREQPLDLGELGEVHPSYTADGMLLGTPGYMSPEQIRGPSSALDGRSDLYSLGLILYELVSLKRATEGATPPEAICRVMGGNLPPLVHRFGRAIPPELTAIVGRATALEPDERYASVRDLAADVRRHLRGEEVAALPDNPLRRVLRWIGRHRLLTLAAVLALLLGAALVASWALYAQKAAVEAAHAREARLARYQTLVGTQAHRIDALFLRLEGMLHHLAEKTAYLLEHGVEQEAVLYPHASFEDGGVGPPDLSVAPLYGMRISLSEAVYKLAPGVDEAAVLPRLRRLAPLRRHYYRMLVDSSLDEVPDNEAAQRNLVTGLDAGVPLRWVYVGLEDGVMFSYPGKHGYPQDYDPRVRPWYRLGSRRHDVRWGNPYGDLMGQGYVLPGVVGVFDDARRFLGVAGAELAFGYMIDRFLLPERLRGLGETFLLDGRGRIVVRSSQRDVHIAPGKLYDAMPLETFPVEEVVDAIRARRSGQAQVRRDGREILVTYYRIPTIGWYYAHLAGQREVLAAFSTAPSPPRPREGS